MELGFSRYCDCHTTAAGIFASVRYWVIDDSQFDEINKCKFYHLGYEMEFDSNCRSNDDGTYCLCVV
jgi:hypothetical protein